MSEFDTSHECRVWFRWGDTVQHLGLRLLGCKRIKLELSRNYVKHEIHNFHKEINNSNDPGPETLNFSLLVAENSPSGLVPSAGLDCLSGLWGTESRGGRQKHIEHVTQSKQKKKQTKPEEKLGTYQLTRYCGEFCSCQYLDFWGLWKKTIMDSM